MYQVPVSRAGGTLLRVPWRPAFLLACLAGCLALGTPAAGAATGVTWSVAQPFRLDFAQGGKALTGQPSGGLSYVLADGTTHHATRLLRTRRGTAGTSYVIGTDQAARTITVKVRHVADGVAVAERVTPTDDVSRVVASLTAGAGERFLGGGQRQDRIDLSHWLVDLKVWNNCASSAPSPLFASSRGYGFSVDSPSVAAVAFPGVVVDQRFSCQWGTSPCAVASSDPATQICVKGPEADYTVYRGSPGAVVSAFTARVGRPVVPPPAQLGLIKWRDSVTGPADVLDDVQELQQRDIPLGAVLLDNPWEKGGCLGALTFDPTAFPDPKAMIAAVHARGVGFMLWVSPEVDQSSRCATGWPRSELVVDDKGEAQVDLTSPTARADFERRLRALFALGVDGVKGDRGDEVDMELVQLAGGPGEQLQNRYPVLFQQAVTQALAAAGRPDATTMFRAAYTGSASAAPGFWVGDQDGDLDGFRSAIRALESSGLGGPTTVGSDVGGYRSSSLTPELFVRWAQLGAISPVFEVGGDGPNATFWKWGEPTVSLFRAAAVLHYELVPTFEALARQAHRTGEPILRPLAYAYPSDPGSWRHDLELLVGPDLLAAPVDRVAGTAAVPFGVYLPPGRWVDLATGRSSSGPATVTRSTPLARLPLYLRGGAATRLDLRAPELWRVPWGTSELTHPGREGWLYAPAAGTAADGGRFATTAAGIDVAGLPARETQVLVLLPRPPRRITIDGEAVAASTAAALRVAERGWTWVASPFRGVLLKLGAQERAHVDPSR